LIAWHVSIAKPCGTWSLLKGICVFSIRGAITSNTQTKPL
jgi:hypothetical protein